VAHSVETGQKGCQMREVFVLGCDPDVTA
jgi:hypothetical protein